MIKSKVTRIGNTKNMILNGVAKLDQQLQNDSENIKRMSQELVPVDTGKLKDSAYVQKIPTQNKLAVDYEVGYSADYAMIVHEDLNRYHPNGQAKFLETAIKNYKSQLDNNVKNSMTQGMKEKQV